MDYDNQVFLYKLADSRQNQFDESFSADMCYPEYPFDSLSPKNSLYQAIREMLYLCGYDRANYNSAQWNPLGHLISPGQTVLIKPNMVFHYNKLKGENVDSVITHPAIIRCIIDYVYIALRGQGKVIVGDASLQSADFEQLCQSLNLDKIRDLYKRKHFDIQIVDFRLYQATKYFGGVIKEKRTGASAADYIEIDLGDNSMLSDYRDDFEKLRVTEYKIGQMRLHHNKHIHRYCVHKSVLNADVVISLPKIKTHRKAGYTCALKNMVGINGHKAWLPHHRKGSVEEGGDEYQYKSIRKKIISESWDLHWSTENSIWQKILFLLERGILVTAKLCPFKDNFFEGSWWGNDTISRTINDLNRVVIYSDKDGHLRDKPQRKLVYLVDGVICGEGEGPLKVTPKQCDMLIWGHNAFVVDMLVVKLMGFDCNRINTLKNCQKIPTYKIFHGKLEDIEIFSNLNNNKYSLSNIRDLIGFDFVASRGWRGYVELKD